jgi:hypothetical protein
MPVSPARSLTTGRNHDRPGTNILGNRSASTIDSEHAKTPRDKHHDRRATAAARAHDHAYDIVSRTDGTTEVFTAPTALDRAHELIDADAIEAPPSPTPDSPTNR